MIPERARADLRAALGAALRFDVSARRLTSLRVGGAVDALATPENRAQLAALLKICAQHGVPQRVLGRGFNTIVRDGGLDGVVIQLGKFRALSECADAARASFTTHAKETTRARGETHARSETHARDTTHARSEIHAHDETHARGATHAHAETHARGATRTHDETHAHAEASARDSDASCLLRVEAGVSHATLTEYCRRRGFAGLEFGAGIPGSVGGWIAMNAGVPGSEIESAVRALEVMTPARGVAVVQRAQLDFRYRALHGLAPGAVIVSALLQVTRAAPATVAARVERELKARAARQPVNEPSCGSVFRNPPARHAGALIDAAGLRGRRHGGARISERHANFIITEDGARAADVLALMGEARAAVLAREGIELEPEVKVWGRETS